MKKSRRALIHLLKRKLFVIIILILTVIVCLSSVLWLSSQVREEQFALVNAFGRQRVLIQMMAKDANRKFAILQALQNGSIVDSEEALRTKLNEINITLKQELQEFDHTNSSIRNGFLIYDQDTINLKSSIKSMENQITGFHKQWKDFYQNMLIIKDADHVMKQAAEALIYINSEDDLLLSQYDFITEGILATKDKSNTYNMLIVIALFAISFLTLCLSIYQLQQYVVVPLGEIYKGIADMNQANHDQNERQTAQAQLKPVMNEIHEMFDKQSKLLSLIKNMNRNISFQDVLEFIYSSFSTFVPYAHIGIALLVEEGEYIEASFGISDPELHELPKKLIGLKAKLSDTSLGQILQTGKPRVINDLDEYTKSKPEKLYNTIIKKEGVKASITLPLKINNSPVGIIFFSNTEKNIYNKEHVQFLETLADSIAISLNQNIYIDELLYSSLLALAKMAESRDEDTGEHLERMKRYTERITEYLLADNKYKEKITTDFIRDIKRFSPMHDIGKVGIRDGILLKPGRLTDEEYAEMKKHAAYGAEVLKTAEKNIEKFGKNIFGIGIEIAQGHHEKWDGSGYPFGKSGEDIPLSARIVTVADVFDALTSKRPYKEAFPFELAFEMLESGSGTHFDPSIIESIVVHKIDLYKLYLELRENEGNL